MSFSRLLYLNALFDLQLGGYPSSAVERSAAEMSVLFYPFSEPGDAVLLDAEIPGRYPEYLRLYGLCSGEVCGDVRYSGGAAAAVAWGWNEQSVDCLDVRGSPSVPSLDVVRNLNNRSFCAEMANRYGFGVPGSTFCSVMKEVEEAVKAVDAFPLVIKPAFGGSGFGLRISDNPDELTKELGTAARYLAHGGLVIEPWLRRVADLSTVTLISPEGVVDKVRFERQGVNGHGSFYGIYCSESDPRLEKWKPQLGEVTRILSEEIFARGYFGPVGIDSFVYIDPATGSERLACAIEINARYTMGFLAQQLRDRIAPGKHTLFRFIGAKRCRLPDSIEEWIARLGKLQFDSSTRNGILLLTPPRMGFRGTWRQPQRSAFFIAADSGEEVERLDQELRRMVERP